MEKETFSNVEVGDVINAAFIPMIADVDYFDAMDMQEHYNVSVLPTILVINSKGDVQRRLIGQKSPASLMKELNMDFFGSAETNNQEDGEYVETAPVQKKKDCFIKRWLK